MRNRFVLLAVFLFLFFLHVLGDNRIYFIKDSLKFALWEGDSSVVIMDVSPAVRLPVSGDSTLIIPASVTLEGRDYRVEGVEEYAFCNHPEVRHLIVSEGVWSIRGYAFQRCLNLESVHLPVSLGFIEPTSFAYCPKLKNVIADDGNDMYDSREDCNAVIEKNNKTLLLGCRCTQMPDGVTTIGQCAYLGRLDIDSLVIPEGVEAIESAAFCDCVGLKYVALPKSLKSIGKMAFYGCTSLEGIFIPAGVNSIGENAFGRCHALKSLVVSSDNQRFDSRDNCNAIVSTANDSLVQGCGASRIVEGVKSIGEKAFWGASLTKIQIPSTVTAIGPGAFGHCRFCTSIEVSAYNKIYNSYGDCNAILETATGKLVKGCGLTRIPKEAREIGEYAFSGMCMPSNFIVPEGVHTICHCAFTDCDFESVKLPSTLRVIGENAFSSCQKLGVVDIDSPALHVGRDAFRFCYSLESVRLPLKVTFETNTVFEYSPFQKVYEGLYGPVEM